MRQTTKLTPRSRSYTLPLMVALPVFFILFALIEGFSVLAIVENGWNSGAGNVWWALQSARSALWVYAAAGGVSGLAWAWIILQPLRRYKAQLDRLLEGEIPAPLDYEGTSEMSSLAVSINRVMEKLENNLPQKVKSILETVSSGVILLDLRGHVEWVNASALRYFDLPKDRREDTTYQTLFARSTELIEFIGKVLESRSDFPPMDLSFLDRLGESRNLRVQAAWVRNSECQPIALVLSLVDRSRLESFSDGVQTAGQLSSLGKIAAGIAHEVRNPLASIRGLAQILANATDYPPEKIKTYGKVMMEEIDRVNQVIDRLSMMVASSDEKVMTLSAASLIESVFEMARHTAKKRQVQLVKESPEEGLILEGQPRLLVQALLNLVLNGIEACQAHGKVTLAARSEPNDKVAFIVSNDGPPIPASEMEAIFQPFYTTKDHAIGLGLAITESVVRNHGGTVTVISQTDSTQFTILLPTHHHSSETEQSEPTM